MSSGRKRGDIRFSLNLTGNPVLPFGLYHFTIPPISPPKARTPYSYTLGIGRLSGSFHLSLYGSTGTSALPPSSILLEEKREEGTALIRLNYPSSKNFHMAIVLQKEGQHRRVLNCYISKLHVIKFRSKLRY